MVSKKCITKIIIKISNWINIHTMVRAAFIGFLDPTTALMEADAIRPAIIFHILSNFIIQEFLLLPLQKVIDV